MRFFSSHLCIHVLQGSFKHHRAVWVAHEPHPSMPANTQLNIWLPWLKAVTAAAQGLLRHEQKQCAIPAPHLWKKEDIFSLGPLSPSHYPQQATLTRTLDCRALTIRRGRNELLFYNSSREVLSPNMLWPIQSNTAEPGSYLSAQCNTQLPSSKIKNKKILNECKLLVLHW